MAEDGKKSVLVIYRSTRRRGKVTYSSAEPSQFSVSGNIIAKPQVSKQNLNETGTKLQTYAAVHFFNKYHSEPSKSFPEFTGVTSFARYMVMRNTGLII